MANLTTYQKLKRKLFTSFELTAESNWSGSIIDDYLNISDNFGLIANTIDEIINGKQTTTGPITETPYTIKLRDVVIWVDASDGDKVVYLNEAVLLLGKMCTVQKIDTTKNKVRIYPTGTDLLNGLEYFDLLMQWEYLSPIAYETGWRA